MFTWIDIIAPWGISLVTAALCIWGAIKGKDAEDPTKSRKPIIVVCSLTAFVFLMGIPTWYLIRWSGTKADYTTSQGLKVRAGSKGQCEKEDVEKLVKDATDFWAKQNLKADLKGKFLVCLDTEKVTLTDRVVYAYTSGMHGNMIVGFNGKKEYTHALVMHELGHVFTRNSILKCDEKYKNDKLCLEKTVHDYFVRVGYKH